MFVVSVCVHVCLSGFFFFLIEMALMMDGYKFESLCVCLKVIFIFNSFFDENNMYKLLCSTFSRWTIQNRSME